MSSRWVHSWGLIALALAALGASTASAQIGSRRAYRNPGGEPPEVNVLYVTAIVPADAEISINGTKTTSKGSVRHFVSPPLDPARQYSYEFRVKWKVAGKGMERTRKLSFKPGDQLTVDFTKEPGEAVKPAPKKSVYDHLGGAEGVKALVDDFTARALADPKANFVRKGTPKEWKATPANVALLKTHLVQVLSTLTGGPKTYSGPSMKEAHKGMQITSAEFHALFADLKASLDKLKVPAKAQNELLELVAGTKKDIVQPVAPLPKPMPKPKSLYERLGGEAAIKAVVDDFTTRVAADPKVNFTRKGTDKEWKATPENVAKLKGSLVQMIGAATGGPQKYTGKSMKEAHKGMKITAAEFDASAADLKASLDKLEVPAKEQSELLKIVGSTKKDIVGQ